MAGNEHSTDATTLSFTIPKATPSGDYIARIEHIGLHAAAQPNGAQFYLSCAQITVTGGGSGTPAPLVAFPGAYKATDPGILFQIYYPVVCLVATLLYNSDWNLILTFPLQPTSYTIPGPAVWTG